MSNAKYLFIDGPIQVHVAETTPEALEAALVRVNRYLWVLADQLRRPDLQPLPAPAIPARNPQQ